MRLNTIRTLAALGLTMFAAGEARAYPLSYSSYSVLNNQTVTLNDAALGISNESGGSGEITLSGTNTPGGALLTWCIDIVHDLPSSGQFLTEHFLTGSFSNAVNALLSRGLALLGTDTNASSALQVAIWEEEYGSALTVTAPAAVISLANTYMGNVASGAWVADASKLVLVYDGSGAIQNQATLVAVPEPASAIVLGLALVGTGFIHQIVRRRNRV